MAKRGRKSQPTVLKLLRGNPGKRKLPRHEPQPEKKFPPCPERFTGAAREAWERFAAALEAAGVGTRLDGAALELLASAYERWLDADEQVRKTGPIWMGEKKTDSGLPSWEWNPYQHVRKQEEKTIAAMLREFGMTPSSRSGLSIKPAEAVDEFGAFISKKQA